MPFAECSTAVVTLDKTNMAARGWKVAELKD